MDYEIQYRDTLDYVDRMLAENTDILDVYRICVPFKVQTWMLPPAEVYFTALSRMLNNASEVQRLSWDIVKSDGQSTDRPVSYTHLPSMDTTSAMNF